MKPYACLLLIFINCELLAQKPLYSNYQRYDVENGLPQNLVSGIVQDADGFIWVSTLDGLARFDGKEFLTFRHQPSDSTSLSYNSIQALIKDEYNNLWIDFVNHHYNKIDLHTLKITKPGKISFSNGYLSNESLPKSYPRQPFWGNEKNWLRFHFDPSNKNLTVELLDINNKKLHTFLRKKYDLSGKIIYAFSEDANGKLWLLTDHGLEVSDDQWENFKSINFPVEFRIDPEKCDFLAKLFHFKDQRMAILQGNKVIIYNPKNGELKAITTSQPQQNNLKSSSTTKDIQGCLVFEYQNYIYRLEPDDQLTLLWKNPNRTGIRSIFIDRTNTLWIGTDPDGLYKINLLTPNFESHPYQDDFITDVLVNEIGVARNQIERDDLLEGSPYYSRYAYTEDGNLILSLQMGTLERSIVEISNRNLLIRFKNEYQGWIAGDPNIGICYFDASGFLYKWNDISKPPTRIKTEYKTTSIITDFLMDGDHYWISTQDDGVHQFKEDKIIKTIKPYGNYSPNIIRNDPTQKNILWIGTVTGGLFKWDKVLDTLVASYTMDNGLPNNTINSIVFDALGFMWMSTNNGITRFNTANEIFSNYSVADGLIESEFNRHHGLLLPDGRIAMGGSKGYSVFRPENFGEDTYAPEVFISNFMVNNKPVDHRADTTILKVPVNQIDRIELSHNNNTIGFEIAAMQFNAPEKIKYRYRLEGYDRNWIETEGDRAVRFTQLPYGDYTLLLNASNTIGKWSPAVRELAIKVHPPFWLTWWAYSVYVIVIGLSVRAYWRGYKRRLIAKQEAAFNFKEASRLRELDEIKTRFFSNITHEFRTPLTLILSPLEKYLGDDALSLNKAQTLLNNNYRHASQLLNLVNQLLDIAKLEAGQMQVNVAAGDFADFAEQCVSSFQTQATAKNIALTFLNRNVSGNYLFDQDKWEKIVFNLVSNAIKFTPSGGRVGITINSLLKNPPQTNHIQLQVQDSGVGIEDEEMPKIFERFYQVDDSSTRKHEGTGIGLSLVKELVTLMDGTIHVSSVKDQGTLFTIEMPVKVLKKIPPAREVTSVNNFHVPAEDLVPGADHDLPVILVVEDNEELRVFIKESLVANWTVLEASNGLDGWTVIESELPEIVISDVMMPGMSGFELCSKSKKDIRTSHINFIMLTAKAAQESKIEGLESGADEYITKPFHLYELELRIKNLLLEQHNLRKHMQEKWLPDKPVPALPQVTDAFLLRLQTFLEANLDNTTLKVETVAEAMAMSKSTLSRKLKMLLNISISDYIKQYRLQKASVLLLQGHNVSEVAYQVGFESASYFAMCFKEHFNQTPSRFIHGKD